MKKLTDYEYAKEISKKIKDKVLDFEEYEPAFEIVENAGTAHINVVDENGMACSITSTEMGLTWDFFSRSLI